MNSITAMGLAVAAGLYSLGGWLGGRFHFNKSFSQNYHALRANRTPMPAVARSLQLLAIAVAVVSVLCFFLPAAKAQGRALPPPIFGTTPAEIDAMFPITIDQNMRANANFHVHNLSAEELANLAVLYHHANGGNTLSVLQIMAQNVDAEGLTRVAAAFGQAATEQAVNHFSKPEVALAFASSPRKAVVPATINRALSTAPSRLPMKGDDFRAYRLRVQVPNLDYTIYEIYLNYRTLPVGSVGVGAALVETSVYAGFWLSAAWTAGYTVGTATNSFLNAYFPNVTIALGNGIGALVDGIRSTLSDATSCGKYQYDLNGAIQSSEGDSMPGGSAGDSAVYGDGYNYAVSLGGGGTIGLVHPKN